MKKIGLVTLFLSFVILFGYAQSASDVVIPKPNLVTVGSGELLINGSVDISQKGAKGVSKYLKKELEEKFGINCKAKGTSLSLVVDKGLAIVEEGYVLDITSEAISISASTETGAFYGVQSIIQLIRAGVQGSTITLSCQTVEDAPRFSWRSYMLDESRYFLGKEDLFRMLDILAELKINVLHWHLTDDAGWRLEIKKYPLLTEIGAKRKDTQVGGWHSTERSGEPYEGYYTQKDVKEILAYARERHIKVVPEIEMPGHASAPIAAYPWLGMKNEKIEIPAEFGKHYHTFDVIDPRVQTFLKDVVAEVIELFDADVIHIGGDEVRFDHWEEDADMLAYKKKKGFSSFMDIQIEFTNEMSRFIDEQGASMMGWNEILGTNLHEGEIKFEQTSTKISPNVIVHFWKGDLKDLAAAAKQGYKLVNSNHFDTYLDYTYEALPLTRAYGFDPIPEGLPAEYHQNIIGLGCQMWREWLPTFAKLQSQTFPRIAAYAEVGWTQKDQKKYDDFVSRLDVIVERWKKEGINIPNYDKIKCDVEK